MIYATNCENIVSVEGVWKLGIQVKKHPMPYKLAWLKKRGEVTISILALVSFPIRSKYEDVVWCHVIAMDAYNLLLGRPRRHDKSVVHDGRVNTYSFMFKSVKFVLVPNKDPIQPNSARGYYQFTNID